MWQKIKAENFDCSVLKYLPFCLLTRTFLKRVAMAGVEVTNFFLLCFFLCIFHSFPAYSFFSVLTLPLQSHTHPHYFFHSISILISNCLCVAFHNHVWCRGLNWKNNAIFCAFLYSHDHFSSLPNSSIHLLPVSLSVLSLTSSPSFPLA